MNRLAVEPRTVPTLGSVEFVAHGVVDDPCNDRSIVSNTGVWRPMLQPHGDAELREPVGEVGGAVQRVDVPAELAFHPLPRSLFAVDAVLGKRFTEPRANEPFHGAVGHGDQVHVALVLGLHALGKKLPQARTGLARNGRSLGNPGGRSIRRAQRCLRVAQDPVSPGAVSLAAGLPWLAERVSRLRPASEMLRI